MNSATVGRQARRAKDRGHGLDDDRAAVAKKRTASSPEQILEDSARRGRRVCRREGGRAGGLSSGARSTLSGRLPGQPHHPRPCLTLCILRAPEARRLAERLEIHHTPKHGSWLNIAAIELSARSGQCLGRRIPALATMRLAATPQYSRRSHPLALHHRRRSDQTPQTLPEIIAATGY